MSVCDILQTSFYSIFCQFLNHYFSVDFRQFIPILYQRVYLTGVSCASTQLRASSSAGMQSVAAMIVAHLVIHEQLAHRQHRSCM